MTFYFAAKYSNREYVQGIARVFREYGHTVTSEWLEGHHTDRAADKQREYAQADLDDIRKADALVLFQLPCGIPEHSTGRAVEFGYAYALHKPVIVVGHKTSVFHYLPGISSYDTVDEFSRQYL